MPSGRRTYSTGPCPSHGLPSGTWSRTFRCRPARCARTWSFAEPGATDDDIRDVPVRTKLDTLVGRLPHGLDTPVGHRGSKLSGGERQRIAIGHALLCKPRLLLLDESTSQLDAVNELALRDVVAELARETTVLVVAHRLSARLRSSPTANVQVPGAAGGRK